MVSKIDFACEKFNFWLVLKFRFQQSHIFWLGSPLALW